MLLLLFVFPVAGSAALGAAWSHSSSHVNGSPGGSLSPLRPDDPQQPADRESRPSPPSSLISAAESLAAAASSPSPDAALSSPLLGALLAGAAAALQIGPTPTPEAEAATPTRSAQTTAVSPRTLLPSAGEAAATTAAPAQIAKAKPSAKAVVAPSKTSATVVAGPAGYPFGPSSVWRQVVSSAALNSNSSEMVGQLSNYVTSLYNGVAAFNVDDYNTTFYSVTASTPKTNVGFTDCQNKGSEPDGLAAEFAQVPIPSNAVAATGTDAEMTIYSASTNQLWEFWEATHDSDGWHACWGGRIDNVSTSPGYFPGGFGATATGLPVAGGMVSIADVKAGVINHALSLEIPGAANWDDFSYPAQRSDGDGASAIPEGTRFRLSASVNVNALNLTPLGKMIAKAAQTYGFIVTDQAGAVAVQAQSAAGAASNPWPAAMAGVPDYQILTNFPWAQLQALPKNWGE